MSAWKNYAIGAAAILGASGIAYYLYKAYKEKEHQKEKEEENPNEEDGEEWEDLEESEEVEGGKIDVALMMDESLVESWDLINQFVGIREQIEENYPTESEEKKNQIELLIAKCKEKIVSFSARESFSS